MVVMRLILWWLLVKILVLIGINGFLYIYVVNYMMCRRIKCMFMMCDVFVYLVMCLIFCCMKCYLFYIIGKLVYKKMFESYNIYVFVFNLFSV